LSLALSSLHPDCHEASLSFYALLP
jgi:hypothetical protein